MHEDNVHHLTVDRIKVLQGLLSKFMNTEENSSTMSAINCAFSGQRNQGLSPSHLRDDWVINSGATNRMTMNSKVVLQI